MQRLIIVKQFTLETLYKVLGINKLTIKQELQEELKHLFVDVDVHAKEFVESFIDDLEHEQIVILKYLAQKEFLSVQYRRLDDFMTIVRDNKETNDSKFRETLLNDYQEYLYSPWSGYDMAMFIS